MTLTGAIARNALGLALFAVVTVGVIALTEQLTRDEIRAQQAAARQRALLEILPADTFDNVILEDVVLLDARELGLDSAAEAYIARRAGVPVAAVIPVLVPDGYSGRIRMIVGIRPDGSLAGARVLEHRETPGLGDAIEARKSDWIDTFKERSLGNPATAGWDVRKQGGEFDAFTGATITPRAVIRAIHRSLVWFEAGGRELLFSAGASAGASAAVGTKRAMPVSADSAAAAAAAPTTATATATATVTATAAMLSAGGAA